MRHVIASHQEHVNLNFQILDIIHKSIFINS